MQLRSFLSTTLCSIACVILPAQAAETLNRYAMANACWAVQETSSNQFLVVDSGTVTASGMSLEDASPFYLKPSWLGRYLFYTTDQRYLATSAQADPPADGVSRLTLEAGRQVSGNGDLVEIIEPAKPVSETINQAGRALGETGANVAAIATQERTVSLLVAARDGVEWDVTEAIGGFRIANTLTGHDLAASGGGNRFRFVHAENCAPYPEAELGAACVDPARDFPCLDPVQAADVDAAPGQSGGKGSTTGQSNRNRPAPAGAGTARQPVFGYAETHMHLAGSQALGGRIGHGFPWHRFGIPHALSDCTENHGSNGELGVLDYILSLKPDPAEGFSERNQPRHSTDGWPTFSYWPNQHSQGHHQTYYMWVKRAWLGGLRFMVQHMVANEMLCNVWPHKKYDCDEMDSARFQMQIVKDMETYIDAQEGGPGKGWFRVVYSPQEARKIIEQGKMAVILGIESEKVIGCGEYLDQPECSFADIEQRLDEWYELGLRAVFPLHIFDNAFGGTEISRFTKDTPIMQLYNSGNIIESGHPYATRSCDEVDAMELSDEDVTPAERGVLEMVALQAMQPPPTPLEYSGCIYNARPLTPTGEFFVNAAIDRGIMIELDHSGPLARKRMLQIGLQRGVPMLSGHTGSITVGRDSARIARTGGIISNLSDDPAPITLKFIDDLVKMYRTDPLLAERIAVTGFGSDINGIHHQSAPRKTTDQNPALSYPFTSFDGNVRFDRQVTGQREFDLNKEGVSHYGLYPDYIADLANHVSEDDPESITGRQAVEVLFRSAEAYLQAWETAHEKRNRPAGE